MNFQSPTAPLRSLALTVEEPAPGAFRWRVLESQPPSHTFVSLACSEASFAAYDAALASGYGALQRLVGNELQFGPRADRAAGAAVDSPTVAASTALSGAAFAAQGVAA